MVICKYNYILMKYYIFEITDILYYFDGIKKEVNRLLGFYHENTKKKYKQLSRDDPLKISRMKEVMTSILIRVLKIGLGGA